MKRFHVHVHVQDLAQSVDFYSKMFATEPIRMENDYAKWMLDDPRINFAISTRGNAPGVDHLGMQTDSAEELDALRSRAIDATIPVGADGLTSCCYARSNKHWIVDPQGVAWEHFHTLADIPVFGERSQDKSSACCVGGASTAAVRSSTQVATACCD